MASDTTKVSSDENASNLTNDCLNRLKSLQFDGISLLTDEHCLEDTLCGMSESIH